MGDYMRDCMGDCMGDLYGRLYGSFYGLRFGVAWLFILVRNFEPPFCLRLDQSSVLVRNFGGEIYCLRFGGEFLASVLV